MRVTFTGVDETTDFNRLDELSLYYPFVEWGILYSASRCDDKNELRYPETFFIQNLTDGQNNCSKFALHLCGRAAFDLPVARKVFGRVNRFQLNFNASKTTIDVKKLNEVIENCDVPVITQYNLANRLITREITERNHHLLFDSSGGRGIYRELPKNQFQIPAGFAGGIGPDNVDDVLKSLDKSFQWIDMESKVRTNDHFDLDKCEQVLKIVEKHNKEIKMDKLNCF